jgi:diguanylate cyclase (GGDEF)-like protein
MKRGVPSFGRHPDDRLRPELEAAIESLLSNRQESEEYLQEAAALVDLMAPGSREAAERTRVLLVCRTRRQCAKLGLWFDRMGVQFEARTRLDEAVDVVTSDPPSAIVVQWSLTDRRGQRALDVLRDAMSTRTVPMIALCRSSRAARAALEAGATDAERWPFDPRLLAHRVSRIAASSIHDIELRHTRHRLDAAERSIAERESGRAGAATDELTGLPSRRAFERALKGALAAGASAQRRVAVVVFDIDRFRSVNQAIGRHAGNGVLQEMAQRLVVGLTPDHYDPALGPGTISSMAARLTGDQFAVLLSGIPADFDVGALVEQFRRDLVRDYKIVGGEIVHVTTSIGVGIAPDDGASAEELLQVAEYAVGEASDAGGGTVRFYGSARRPLTARLAQLTNLVAGALEREEFAVQFQPIVDAASERIVAAESLLRWNSPELGSVPPMEFVPIAEERGLMVRIGAWVLDESCRHLRAWIDEGLPTIRLSVNISLSQLVQDRLAGTVASIVRTHDLDPSLIELEISERGALRDDPGVMEELRGLRALGCRLAIDDFGTGNSAVAYLKRFPLTTLKIDRSFVSGVTDSDEDAVITTAMTAMGRQLRLDVVAEGVERPEQLQFLRECGCTEMQGFLFSTPVDPDRFRDLLARRSHRLRTPAD